MKVREITLTNVMRHESTKLVFPDRGIVVVTGANGAGKSSIIEAVSVGLWGQSLRKTPVWKRNAKGSIVSLVEVGREALLVKRSRSKSKELLDFSSIHASQTYDTKTKAQEALAAVVGTHARWRRTHAFSSQDAAHFTLATDAERKRLLEDILGLERFDAAHAAASRDRRQLEKELVQLESVEALTAERVRAVKVRLEDALEAARQIPASLPTTLPDLEKIEKRLKAKRGELAELDEAIQELSTELRLRTGRIEAADAQAEHVGGMEHCEVCGQPVGEPHQARLRRHAAAVRAENAATVSELTEALKSRRERRVAAQTRANELVDEKSAAARAVADAQARANARARAEDRVRTLRQDLEDAHDRHDEARAKVAEARASLAVLTAAERVLSLTGVRSYLLGQALAGIEEIANAWLARLVSSELTLTLKPYAEKANGGIKDAISLEVEGAGEGYGYAASSGGERRRIDIALLLALGEVAEAAVGISTGTMFFDEVFDALDDEGVSTAIEVLAELAKDRCVVVISHNSTLVAKLPWVRRWTVAAGTVEEKRA